MIKPRVVFECQSDRDRYRIVVGSDPRCEHPKITIEIREQDALGSETWVPAMGIPGVVFAALLIASGVLSDEESNAIHAAIGNDKPNPMAS